MKIYYFSRTGTSEKIAREIAMKNNTEAERLDDGVDWSGAINFLKGGRAAASRKSAEVSFSAPSENEEIILVFPIWAGTFPPAVRGFLDKVDKRRVTAVALSMGTVLKGEQREAFKKVYDLAGKNKAVPSELL